MGFFFKNKKKNKEEETVTPVVETTPEVPAKEGMILVREGIKLGLPTVSMDIRFCLFYHHSVLLR